MKSSVNHGQKPKIIKMIIKTHNHAFDICWVLRISMAISKAK
jgi:hypothetical protein